MAPKADVKSLQRSLQAISQQVASLGKGNARAKGLNWSCTACAEGANNYPHRSSCFKCGAAKPGGSRPAGSQSSGSGKARAPSRPAQAPAPAAPPRKAPVAAPALEVADSPTPGEAAASSADQDPVTLELTTAKSQHLWALRLKEPARSKELPQAEKRLAEAQAASQERKPPAERLRAALSRVEAKQRRLDEATTATATAQAALDSAVGEKDQAQEQLREAQRELREAQSLHVQHTRLVAARENGSQEGEARPYIDALLQKLEPGSELSVLLLKHMETNPAAMGPPPPYPTTTVPPAGGVHVQDPAARTLPNPPGGADPRRCPAREVRSRSRSRGSETRATPTAGADASMAAEDAL